MREMLEPVFGESGAVVAQFLITLVVILLVLGLVYWVVRRFGGVRFNGGARGRLPRLAVVDAVPVDSRRKLVLVRRDNVEHLLLIGGASDVLVEPGIQRVPANGARPRPAAQAPQQPPPVQQAQRPAPAPQAPQQSVAHVPPPAPAAPHRPESSGISEPIPFPQPQAAPARPARRAAASPLPAPPPETVPQRRAATRPMPVATEPLAAVASPSLRPLPASAHFEEPTRPTRVESVMPPPAESFDRIPDPPAAPRGEEPETAVESPAPVAARAPEPELRSEPAPAIALDDSPADPSETPEDEQERASKVSDLEREMARLLGEITSRRES